MKPIEVFYAITAMIVAVMIGLGIYEILEYSIKAGVIIIFFLLLNLAIVILKDISEDETNK